MQTILTLLPWRVRLSEGGIGRPPLTGMLVAGFFALGLSLSSLRAADSWTDAIAKSAPKYWYRFEETNPATPAKNQGSAGGAWDGTYGPEITAADNLGKTSVLPVLGKAIEFTGPAVGNTTGKFVDFAASAADPDAGIPELINLRPPTVDKTTTVEYWIKTTQKGSTANQTWTSPSLLAHESGGDGDMYWGWINDAGDLGFSTSDIAEIYARRDGTNKNVTDGQWHHIVLVKEWHVSQACRSIMYVDGGTAQGGATIIRNTGAGDASYQDADGGIRYLGFTQTGGGDDVQFIGTLDELVIYDRALTEVEVGQHYSSVAAVDTDGDGLPDAYEVARGLDPNVNDANQDADNDGLTNLQEFQKGTDPKNADTDGDGLKDSVETKTGTFVNANDTGTDPFNPDTDGDGLKDGVETNTGIFVNASNTGSNPFKVDTDGDSYDDAGEVVVGSNPNDKSSLPPAGNWTDALAKSAPKYWYRFEETDPATAAKNQGSAGSAWDGAYGPEITAADNLGKTSVLPVLGKAIEFTGPAVGNTTGKYLDLAAKAADPEAGVPELINLRPPTVDKTTTVEYCIKTTQKGSVDNQTWNSPSLLAHESGGDGDMYWGWINDAGDFSFSTSDLTEIYARRDGNNKNVTDGQWHHVVLVKEWHVSQACRSIMYLDGGTPQGGATIVKTTAAGNVSYQDSDGGIRYLGFTQTGGGDNVQFIGLLDELAIYDRALTEAEVRQHYRSVFEGDTDGDGLPDAFELGNGLNPNVNDASQDPDNDGSTNLQEFQRKTNPQIADTDGDGAKDGVETGTGVWVSANDRGTNPLLADSDGDGIPDGPETNTGVFVSATDTGTDPNKVDSDGDGFKDGDEIALGTKPSDAASKPTAAADWVSAIKADAPAYWWRFEGTSVAAGVNNEGSVAGFNGIFGEGIVNADLGKTSASAGLGKALEFTGPEAPNTTTKFVDFGADIPELANLRTDPIDGKATTVEYWIKTTQKGSVDNQTWNSPSLFAHESGGDGDMYWGWINDTGQLGFSTSDLVEIYADGVTDGNWHHIVLVKIWNQDKPSVSHLYIDGGALGGGQSFETTTPAGNPSQQDEDGGLRYLGFTQTGGGGNVQFIGQIDEVAIYNKPLNEAQARVHFLAGGGAPPTELKFNPLQVSGGTITISWTGSGTLQEASNLTGGSGDWSNVNPPPAANTYAVSPGTAARKFYRLRR